MWMLVASYCGSNLIGMFLTISTLSRKCLRATPELTMAPPSDALTDADLSAMLSTSDSPSVEREALLSALNKPSISGSVKSRRDLLLKLAEHVDFFTEWAKSIDQANIGLPDRVRTLIRSKDSIVNRAFTAPLISKALLEFRDFFKEHMSNHIRSHSWKSNNQSEYREVAPNSSNHHSSC